MFMAQRPTTKSNWIAESGPMVYIAHEMTPFSNKDVVVYSNCEEVRLTVNEGGQTYVYKRDSQRKGMPSPVITFEDVFDFLTDKKLSRFEKRQNDVYLLAEGIINGQVVASHKVNPARRPEKLLLWIDNENVNLEANGSDFVTVVAAISDKNGNIKRLNNYFVKFEIEGEGRILGGNDVMANPAPVRWGCAPVLVQSTLKPGKIKISASVLLEGSQMPASAELEIESRPAVISLVYNPKEAADIVANLNAPEKISASKTDLERRVEFLQRELNSLKLKEVERQQQEFGENR